ncbi:MAG TPA: VanW family protein [Candidatus Binatia bacterium]|nr:VanW family protein [Candidatus Binatia bacterium]
MSLLRTIKLIAFGFALFVFFPNTSEGAELKFADKTWQVQPQVGITSGYVVRNDFDLKEFLAKGYEEEKYLVNAASLDTNTVKVLDEAAAAINQQTKNPKLVIEDNWAKEFEPGQNGQALDIYKTLKLLSQSQSNMELPVLLSKPATSLEETNNLGIKELVAVGESEFSGSPYNRRVNINVGASRFQGLIIKPGEEFSFNKFLGDVDGEHGFLPELVIKKSGLTPEFGGGLCQVSSTAFRAAMNAGLPITERRNHSFAVRYYAPQGTDATIYPGVTDFKFMNDLPSHLLMKTEIVGDKLYYYFYGTKDDRKITFDGPTQYDKQTNGAMKAIWTRWVEKNGEKKEQVFRSTYQPPALFQQTTQASTPNPETAETPNPNNPNQTEPIPAPTETPAPTTT